MRVQITRLGGSCGGDGAAGADADVRDLDELVVWAVHRGVPDLR